MRESEASDEQLQQALAILLASTKTRTRTLPLTEIARSLDVAVARLGSVSAVADRIGLSGKMLRQFSYVRKLIPEVRQMFQKRSIDSVDAATHLAMLPAGDQMRAALALQSEMIDTSDLRAMIQLRRDGDRTSLDKILKRVKETKTKREYVVEFVARGSRNKDNILQKITKFIPKNEIVRLEIRGALGRLILTSRGKSLLSKTARELRVPLARVMTAMLQER
jgi:hypothetical protein